MQNNNYLVPDRDCVKSQILEAMKQIFPVLPNKEDKTNIKNILNILQGFIILRRSEQKISVRAEQKNYDFIVKKKILGIMISFYSNKDVQNTSFIKIKRTGLDQLQIFSKKLYEGLDIFYLMLIGILINDQMFIEIKNEFKNIFYILESVARIYYQKNSNQKELDGQDWESFKNNIQLYFNQEEMKNLLRILVFCTILYFDDQRETSENMKKFQQSENMNNVSNSETDSQQIDDTLSTTDFISSEPSLEELSKIIQTNWEVQSERPTVNSFKIVKRNEHGVCIYLFTQLVNMIFSKIENQYKIQDRNLYNTLMMNQNISFYLVSEKSIGGGLPDLLQDMIHNIIVLEKEQSEHTLKQMRNLYKQNKFKLEISKVREILHCKDARLEFIQFNGQNFELKDFQLGYQIALSIQIQQLLRINTRNKLIKLFGDQKIQSAIEIALELAESISNQDFYLLEIESQKTQQQYMKHFKKNYKIGDLKQGENVNQ